MASATSGISQVSGENPRYTTIMISRPSVGMARQMLARLTMTNAPRPVCPIATPSGSAITAATSSARPL